MNDQFLYDARPQMRRSFATELYKCINASASPRTRIGQFLRNPERVFVAALAAALVAGVAWQMLNTEARFIKSINGIDIREMNYRIIDYASFREVTFDEEVLSQPPPRVTRTVAEAMELLTFGFNLPSWIPDGLTLWDQNRDNPQVWNDYFFVTWMSPEHRPALNLLVHEVKNGWAAELNVAPGKWKDLEIENVDAVLVKGDFQIPFNSYEEYKEFVRSGGTWRPAFWNDELGLRLTWVYDGIYYELSTLAWAGWHTFGPTDDLKAISEGDLIRVAESMIP